MDMERLKKQMDFILEIEREKHPPADPDRRCEPPGNGCRTCLASGCDVCAAL